MGEDFKKLLPYLGELAGPSGEGEVEITPFRVAFNGSGDLSHESFILTADVCGFEFCKTARKPYDLAVKTALLLARFYGVVSRVSCDDCGSDNVSSWLKSSEAPEASEEKCRGGHTWRTAWMLIDKRLGKEMTVSMELAK